MNQETEKTRYLVSQNKLLEAIQELDKLVSSKKGLERYKDDISLLAAKHHRIRDNKIKNIVSEEKTQVSENQLANSILKLTVQISITIKTGEYKNEESEATAPRSVTAIGFILMPLLFLSIIIGIGGLSYYKFIYEEEDEAITIFGKVYDVNDNNIPIKNARVEVVDLVGIFSNTDNAGTFEFEIEKPDKKYLEFQVNHEDYETQSFKIPINPNKNNEQSLEKFLMKKIEKAEPNKR